MTEREKFEQWASMPQRQWHCAKYDFGFLEGQYMNPSTQDAWEAWQAATDASTHKAIYEDEV